MTYDALGLLLVNGLFLVAGAGVTGALGVWRGARALPRNLGMAYLTGVAAYGVVAQLLYVAGASMSRAEVILVCLVLGSGAVVGVRGHAGTRRPVPLSVVVPVALILALFAVDLWFQPLWGFDSWTFWTPKAHGLYALNGLDPQWFTSAEILGGARREYPLLLPAIEAAGFRFTGYETSLLDLQSWLLLVGLLGVILQTAAGRARTVVVASVVLMVGAAPSTISQLASAEADIPLAAFFAAAGVAGVLWLETRRPGLLILASVLAAGAAATKVEGAIFAGALFAGLAIATFRSSRRDAGAAVVAYLAVLAVGVVPWRAWVAAHAGAPTGKAPTLAPTTLLDHLGHVPYATLYLLDKLLDPRGWLLIVPLWAVAMWVAWRRGRRDVVVFAACTVALGFLGLIVTYWATPLDLHFHLARSARRVVTSLVFFCAATVPLLDSVVPGRYPADP